MKVYMYIYVHNRNIAYFMTPELDRLGTTVILVLHAEITRFLVIVFWSKNAKRTRHSTRFISAVYCEFGHEDILSSSQSCRKWVARSSWLIRKFKQEEKVGHIFFRSIFEMFLPRICIAQLKNFAHLLVLIIAIRMFRSGCVKALQSMSSLPALRRLWT